MANLYAAASSSLLCKPKAAHRPLCGDLSLLIRLAYPLLFADERANAPKSIIRKLQERLDAKLQKQEKLKNDRLTLL